MLEDNPNDATLALELLARAGFTVEADVARSKDEFVERVPVRSYDLILSDFSMPGWDGLEALRWTRLSESPVPFIYVSGTMGEELAVECIQEGATDYVLKTNLARLPRAVHRALEEAKLRADRDRALKQLDDSEQRFATAFRASPDGITINSLPDGCFIEANDAFLTMLEYERAELIGRAPLDLGLWEDGEQRVSLLRKLENREPIRRHEALFRTKSGKLRQLEFSAENIEINGAACLLCISRDVTEMRSLERQMRQSQKMEAIGRLAGGVAHDFNNLLGVISGYGDLLRRSLPLDDPRHGKVEQILKAAGRAAGLTRRLLAFSRQQVLQPKVLDLNHVVADMDKMLHRLIGEDIELAAALQPGLWRVRADPGQIEQIVMNLVVNARDAMPQGGRLTIETANAELDAVRLASHALPGPGQYVLLAVSDSGCGIDAETQSHLFEPFFTTKPVGQGTGLGLSTVYGIVKQSNGSIWVYSEVGVGTTFKIYLPRVDEVASAAPHEPPAAAGGSETVLLVEDEKALREVVQETLEANGYTVLAAPGGAEALQIASTYAGPIHAMVIDLVMPGMGGRRTVEEVAPGHPEMKILYMSGYSNEAVAHQGMLSPGAAFLGKPFTAEGLLRRLRELLTA